MREILLVYDVCDMELGSAVESELRRAFADKGESAIVTVSLSVENARDHLPGNVSQVIAFWRIRKSAGEPLSPEAEEGLELLCWLNRNQMNKPSILIAPTRTPRLSAVESELRSFEFVPTGANMVQEVINRALRAKEFDKFLDVEIHLSSPKWGYRIVGKGFDYEREDEFEIDESTLGDLQKASAYIQYVPEWKVPLQEVGEKLLDALDKDQKFKSYISVGLFQAGGERHARIRFAIKPEFHRLALEAVLCPDTRDYWMLAAPVYRRLLVDRQETSGYLFQGGRRIHCLIIDATTSGLVGGVRLKKLTSVKSECEDLETYLKKQTGDFNIGDILMLQAKAGEPPLADQTKRALEGQDWGIVHFGGHSYYDDKNDIGYVYFPGAEEGSVDKVDVKRFGDWLRRVTFTYFSSCDSGAGPFVFGLANRRVSNILGFRWEIDDQLAFEYSKEFYKGLFESRSLEQAFLKARQEMHELHPDDRIWAAPILIKQLIDA